MGRIVGVEEGKREAEDWNGVDILNSNQKGLGHRCVYWAGRAFTLV